LYIAVYGCDEYPAGYDGFTINNPASLCKHPSAYGWSGALILFILVIFGSFMLPTVLIGIVSIKFDEASQRAEKYAKSMAETDRIVETAKAELPDFFDANRLFNIQKLFKMLDTQSKNELVLSELLPFYYYSFDVLFGVVLSREQVGDMFGIADTNRDGNIGIDEFIEFIGVIKNIENHCKQSSDFAEAVFGSNFRSTKNVGEKVSFWNNAMARSDEASINEAWEIIIEAVNASEGDSIREKASTLFNNMDSDKTGDLDSEELEQGFNNCNIHMTKRQTNAFVFSLDEDGDGSISLTEFLALLFDKMGTTSPDEKEASENDAVSAEFPNFTRSETLEIIDSEPNSNTRVEETSTERRSAVWASRLSEVRKRLKVLPPEMIEMRSMLFEESSQDNNNPSAIEAEATGTDSSAEATLARALAAVSTAKQALQKATAEAEAAGAVVENVRAARVVSFGPSTKL
jgi:Ca2+-binding EF-hand superfamily protein